MHEKMELNNLNYFLLVYFYTIECDLNHIDNELKEIKFQSEEALDVCLGSTQYLEEKRELYKIVLRDTWNDLGTNQKAANARGGWVCQCQP